MTVQEILLLDSSAYVSVGVAKLQQILSTMRMFKDERDELEISVAGLLNDKHELEAELDALGLSENSLAIACSKKDTKIAELEAKLRDLANTKLRVGAINITLDDL